MKCKNCGAEVRSDARFCGKCGNKLSEIILVSSPKANTENLSNSNEKKSKDENTILLNTNADSHSVVMSENESNDKSAANNAPHMGAMQYIAEYQSMCLKVINISEEVNTLKKQKKPVEKDEPPFVGLGVYVSFFYWAMYLNDLTFKRAVFGFVFGVGVSIAASIVYSKVKNKPNIEIDERIEKELEKENSLQSNKTYQKISKTVRDVYYRFIGEDLTNSELSVANGLISVAKENPQSSLEEVIQKYCYDLKIKRYAEISSETHEIWKKIENQKKSCTLETKYGKIFLNKLSELKKFAKTMPDESMSLMDYRKLCAEKAMECQEYLQKEIEAQEQKEENKRLEEQHKEEERIKAEDDRIYGKAPRTLAERFKKMHENN